MWEGGKEPKSLASNTFMRCLANLYGPNIGSQAYAASFIELT